MPSKRHSKRRRKALACPACGTVREYTLIVASIQQQNYLQGNDGRWQREPDTTDVPELRLPVLLICGECGYPAEVPAVVRKLADGPGPSI